MRACKIAIVSSLIVLAAGQPGRATVLGDEASWISGLKCIDLVVDDGKTVQINHDNLNKFALWLMGFQAGIGSVPPKGGWPTSITGSLEAFLPYCGKHPDASVVSSATDFMSFQFNQAHAKDFPKAVDLLDPITPTE